MHCLTVQIPTVSVLMRWSHALGSKIATVPILLFFFLINYMHWFLRVRSIILMRWLFFWYKLQQFPFPSIRRAGFVGPNCVSSDSQVHVKLVQTSRFGHRRDRYLRLTITTAKRATKQNEQNEHLQSCLAWHVLLSSLRVLFLIFGFASDLLLLFYVVFSYLWRSTPVPLLTWKSFRD